MVAQDCSMYSLTLTRLRVRVTFSNPQVNDLRLFRSQFEYVFLAMNDYARLYMMRQMIIHEAFQSFIELI